MAALLSLFWLKRRAGVFEEEDMRIGCLSSYLRRERSRRLGSYVVSRLSGSPLVEGEIFEGDYVDGLFEPLETLLCWPRSHMQFAIDSWIEHLVFFYEHGWLLVS